MGKLLNSVSIGLKLPIIMSVLVVATIIVLSVRGYYEERSAIIELSAAKLAGIAREKSERVEELLHQIDDVLLAQSRHESVISALRNFNEAWSQLDSPQELLQENYITDNPFATGEKNKLIAADAGTRYDQVHREFHPMFDTLKDATGYYDIFLFDTEGNIIYSVFKELDYATNILTGQWKNTGLAAVFERANAAMASEPAVFEDFAPYAPSYGAPAAFIARPVFDENGTRLGVISYQMPIDALTAAVQGNAGLGAEGDAFLIGGDRVLRTDSTQTEVNDVLQTRVDTPAVDAGIAGKFGVLEYSNHRSLEVFGYSQPISYHGVNWILIVENGKAELFAKLQSLLMSQFIAGVSFFAMAVAVSVFMSRSLAVPLKNVNAAVNKVAAKEFTVDIPATGRGDEIGGIARALDEFRQSLADGEAIARDGAFKSAAFEATGSPMLLTDPDMNVVSYNFAFVRLINENAVDFGVPDEVTADSLHGACLSQFEFLPSHVRAKMSASGNLPIREKLSVGNSYIGLLVDLVRDRNGEVIGYVLDFKNQTFQMSSEVLVKAIDRQQARLELDLGE